MWLFIHWIFESWLLFRTEVGIENFYFVSFGNIQAMLL